MAGMDQIDSYVMVPMVQTAKNCGVCAVAVHYGRRYFLSWRRCRFPWSVLPQRFSSCSTLIRWSTFVAQVLQFSGAFVEERVPTVAARRTLWTRSFTRPLCATTGALHSCSSSTRSCRFSLSRCRGAVKYQSQHRSFWRSLLPRRWNCRVLLSSSGCRLDLSAQPKDFVPTGVQYVPRFSGGVNWCFTEVVSAVMDQSQYRSCWAYCLRVDSAWNSLLSSSRVARRVVPHGGTAAMACPTGVNMACARALRVLVPRSIG